MHDTIKIKDIKDQIVRLRPLYRYSNSRFIARKSIELLLYVICGAVALSLLLVA